MNDTPDQPKDMQSKTERLIAESDKNRLVFFKTDLAACFTFASIAETEYKIGDQEAAARNIAHAENGYSTLTRFLSDPKHAKHIPEDDMRELAAGLERLRATLDGLKRAAG